MLKLLKKKIFSHKKKKKNLILSLKVQCIIQNPFIFFKVSPPSSIQLFYINIFYIYIYICILVSHNMHSLYNLKVKYSFIFIIYFII